MNTYGELGIGTTADVRTPTTVLGINATWTSSDPAVATITAGGLATANGVGSVTITATFNGQSGSTTLTVAGRPILTVASNANGIVTSSPSGIDCGATCSAAFDPRHGRHAHGGARRRVNLHRVERMRCLSASGTTCTITLTANRSITATFFLPTLTVTKAGNGRGSVIPSVADDLWSG